MYLAQRLAIFLLTLFAAVTFNFFLPRLVPGDPMGAMVVMYQGRIDPASLDAMKAMYGIDDTTPLIAQYFQYLANIARGDLGRSTSAFPAQVTTVIASSLPWTLGLVGVTTLMSFLIGSGLGLYSAWRRGTRIADGLPTLGLVLSSLPYFWVALLMLFLFAFTWKWFPLSGATAPFVGPPWSWAWIQSVVYHATLPSLAILLTSSGYWLITMRNNAVTVMGDDYVALARAKGLRNKRIINRYVLRNALLPSLTAFGMALGFVLSGSLLTEIVFSYPGLGYRLYLSVVTLDYPLMQGIFLAIAVSVLVINFIVDAIYILLDPRVTHQGRTA